MITSTFGWLCRVRMRVYRGISSEAALVDVTVASRLRIRAVSANRKEANHTSDSTSSLSWLRRGPGLPVAASSDDALLEQLAAALPVGGKTRVLMPVAALAGSPSLEAGKRVPMLESNETSSVLRFSDYRPSSATYAVTTVPSDLIFADWSADGRPLARASAPAIAQAAPRLPGNGVTQLQEDDHHPHSEPASCADTHAQWDEDAKNLHSFASAGNIGAMSELLQSTAAIKGKGSLQKLLASRQPASGATALHQLAAGSIADEADSFARGLELLLSHGLAVDCRAGNGSTPLHWAAGANGVEACRGLLREGADVFAVTYTWNRQIFGKGSGRSPLHWAAEAGAIAAASILLEASAGAGAGLPDERGLLAAEVASGEGHSALSSTLDLAAKQQFVVLEVEKLASDVSAHGQTAHGHLDIGDSRVRMIAHNERV